MLDDDFPPLPSVTSVNDKPIGNDVVVEPARVLHHATEFDFVEPPILHALEHVSTELEFPRPPFRPVRSWQRSSGHGRSADALTSYATIHILTRVSPKYRFNVMIEPERLEVLREIERRTGATPSEQIRRAIDAYLRSQSVLTKKEVARILEEREP